MKPLVSICCITYNHIHFLDECIKGFLIQKTNFPIDILIHDDASTDGTTELIKSYVAKYPEIIKPTFQKENQFSKGKRITPVLIQKAQGKYIALCEGDDYWTDPLKLQKQVDFLEQNTQYSFVVGGFKSFNETTGETNIILKDVEDTPDNTSKGFDITKQRFLNQWVTKSLTLLFRKEALDFKIFNKYKYFRDVHLIYSLLCSGKGYYMKEVFGVYRIHAGGIFSEISEREKYVSYLNNYGELYKKNKSDKFLKQKYTRLLNEAAKRKFYKGKQYRLYLELFLITKSRSHFKNLIKALITKA